MTTKQRYAARGLCHQCGRFPVRRFKWCNYCREQSIGNYRAAVTVPGFADLIERQRFQRGRVEQP